MLPFKTIRFDDRRLHLVYMEIGLLASLLVVSGIFRVPMRGDGPADLIMRETEVMVVEEIQPTLQTLPPPPPAALPPPVEVPDTKVIEEVLLPSIELDLEQNYASPPPPPPPSPEVVAPPPPPPPPREPEIFVVVEQMPELIGGLASIVIEYPDMERRAGIEGRVFLQFVVNEDGTVSDIEVTRGVSVGIDQAAIDALARVRFRPGMQRGHPVKVRFSIPITFRLNTT